MSNFAIQGTGVFADHSEVEAIQEIMSDLMLRGKKPIKGELFQNVKRRAQEKCLTFALKHGLPEIAGYYGIDDDGEFTTCQQPPT